MCQKTCEIGLNSSRQVVVMEVSVVKEVYLRSGTVGFLDRID